MAKYNTILDATHAWVSEFNRFPTDMVGVLMKAEPDSWREVTAPSAFDRVYVFNLPDDCDSGTSYGEIYNANEDGNFEIKMDDGTHITVDDESFEAVVDSVLPMWGTMWQFGDSLDDGWLASHGGIEKMSECGFRIYENDDWGFFFGIDGAGYDFFESHWVPLYKARGLHWHNEIGELNNNLD